MTEVLRHARTFQEAVDMVSQSLPPSGWGYDLVSIREKRVATLEMSNKSFSVRESTNGYHVQTNEYHTPSMVDKNLYVNYGVHIDSVARHTRAEQLVQQHKGFITTKTAAAILSDQVDPFTKQVRSVGNTVGLHETVGSVIVRPVERQVFAAIGMAPVVHNGYISLPMPEDVNENTFLSFQSEKIGKSDFVVNHPEMAQAEQDFIKAKVAYEFEHNIPAARGYLQDALVNDSSNPHILFLLGIFDLKLNQFSTAKASFEKMLTVQGSLHQKMLAHYYLAKISSNSSEQEAHYAFITGNENADPKLKKAALKAAKLKTKKLHPMIQQGDMEQY